MDIKLRAIKYAVPIWVSVIIIGGGTLFGVLLLRHYCPQGMGPKTTAILGSVIGIVVYFISLKLIGMTIINDYCIEFTQSEIIIKAKKYSENINFNNIQTFTIWNSGDEYAKIVINTTKRHKYFVELAKLKYSNKNGLCILEPFFEIENIFFENGFEKSIEKKTTREIIEFKRKL